MRSAQHEPRLARAGLRRQIRCASANHAIASAVDQIRLGSADVMLAGGSDAPLVWVVLKSWEALRVLSPDTCRPFSADGKGVVLGEGAGIAGLESYEHAARRGATILLRSPVLASPLMRSTSSRLLSKGRRRRCATAFLMPG